EDTCEHTGLPLRDIWRYFRHTWATEYRSVPGRSLMFLVRDAAASSHPVMGLIALASSAVQIGVRDEWIGWNPDSYVEQLRSDATEGHVEWLQRLIRDGLEEIYLDDFLDPAGSMLTRQNLANPTPALVGWLEKDAVFQREQHQRLADAAEHKRG